MSRSPAAALQTALSVALLASPDMAAAVGATAGRTRVFDRVPPDAAFPHVELGTMQELDDGAFGIDASEVAITMHAWSRAVGQIEAKGIVDAMRRALDGQILPLDGGHACVGLFFESARYFADPDGITTHVVIEFRALTEST